MFHARGVAPRHAHGATVPALLPLQSRNVLSKKFMTKGARPGRQGCGSKLVCCSEMPEGRCRRRRTRPHALPFLPARLHRMLPSLDATVD